MLFVFLVFVSLLSFFVSAKIGGSPLLSRPLCASPPPFPPPLRGGSGWGYSGGVIRVGFSQLAHKLLDPLLLALLAYQQSAFLLYDDHVLHALYDCLLSLLQHNDVAFRVVEM